MISAFLVLYTRLDDARVLDHGLRRAIVRCVRERPGLTVAELARVNGVDPKTMTHHLRVLARAGWLQPLPQGRGRLWFLPGDTREPAPAPRVVRALHALRGGAATPAALARALGVPRGTAGGLLEGLARLGLARRGESGWSVSAKGDEALCQEAGLGDT